MNQTPEELAEQIEQWKAKAKAYHFGLGCVSGLAQERYMKSHNGQSDPFFMEFNHHLNSEWEEWQKAKATIQQLESQNTLLVKALRENTAYVSQLESLAWTVGNKTIEEVAQSRRDKNEAILTNATQAAQARDARLREAVIDACIARIEAIDKKDAKDEHSPTFKTSVGFNMGLVAATRELIQLKQGGE